MANGSLVSLSDDQITTAKTSIEALDKMIKNGDALIDSGIVTKEDIEQAKSTREITKNILEKFGKK
jgi:hypothetical protein